jgi:hypothetical protein
LSGWIERERWRICRQIEEDHFGKMCPAALQRVSLESPYLELMFS